MAIAVKVVAVETIRIALSAELVAPLFAAFQMPTDIDIVSCAVASRRRHCSPRLFRAFFLKVFLHFYIIPSISQLTAPIKEL